MQGEYVGVTWSRGERGVGMEHVGGVGEVPGEVEPGPADLVRVELDEPGFGYSRT
jgi:hypothetical protein